MTIPARTRVRVKPESESAEMVEGMARTGTVQDWAPDHINVLLDAGQLVSSLSPSDWELIEPEGGQV